MSEPRPYGLYVIANPVLENNGELFLRDRCYTETILQVNEFVPSLRIVARKRALTGEKLFYPRLADVGAELALSVPDYGIGGVIAPCRAVGIAGGTSVRRALMGLVQDALFVHVEGGTSIEAFLAAQLAARLKKRLILEMRGSTVLNLQYMRQRFGMPGVCLVLLHRMVCAYVCRRCYAGLYINLNLMGRYPVAGGLNRAIGDAYLPQGFGCSPKQFKEAARHYLYVGHLEAVKRVDLILSALALAGESLPVGWHLDIVGSGPCETQLKGLAGTLGILDHVTFHGRVEWGEELWRFYQRADLALMASTTEGASRSLLEAMAFGLPVISTRVGIAPELLGNSQLVLVGAQQKFAECLAALVNDPVGATKIGANNWRKAQGFKRDVLIAERRQFWKEALHGVFPERN